MSILSHEWQLALLKICRDCLRRIRHLFRLSNYVFQLLVDTWARAVGNELAERNASGFTAHMRKLIVVGLSILSVGCAGLEARHKTTLELKARFSEVERELAMYHTGESDQVVLRHFRELTDEEHTVLRELYRRCRAGDQNACLPQFNLIYE